MATVQKPFIKRLSEALPENIDWLPHQAIEAFLGIAESQRRRDTAVLEALKPRGWKYNRYSRGYRREAIEVFWTFRQLVRLMGRTEAIAEINKYMEQMHSEQIRQSSSNKS